MFRGPAFPITSLSLANCLGVDLASVQNEVREQRTGLTSHRLFHEFARVPYVGVVGRAPIEDPRRVPLHDRPRQVGLARAAMRDVSSMLERALRRWGSERVGVVLGTSTGGIAASERAYALFGLHHALPDDYSFEQQHAFDCVVRLLCDELGVLGPRYAVSTACSSSAKALAAGGRLLAVGVCDAVLVGGVDSLCLTTLRGFTSLGVMDADVCRPFAVDRAGINVGEGAAFMLIEREGAATVSLASVGETSDAHHMTHPHPRGQGAEAAMQQALEAAQISPGAVGYINAHGTGTVLNDQSEAAAISRLFGKAPKVSSTKGLTGHLLGACGATEAVLTAMAMRQQLAPGNGKSTLATDCALSIARSNEPCHMAYALSNSLAFGGSNASVLLAAGSPELPAEAGRSQEPLCAELVQAIAWQSELGEAPPSRTGVRRILSPRARGRASQLTLMLTEMLEELVHFGFDAEKSPVVYGSAFGEMKTTMELLEMEAQRAESSPLRFQHSVHNTAAGLLSIATGNTSFSTSVAAGNLTFAMSMLEGITYLAHSSVKEIAVLVADETSAPKLPRQRYQAAGAAFHLRRLSDPAAAGVVVHAPRRLRSRRAERSTTESEFGGNPVADSLKLVRAFRTREPQTIDLADHDASGLAAESDRLWVLEVSRGCAQ